jgi:hypothetical protein
MRIAGGSAQKVTPAAKKAAETEVEKMIEELRKEYAVAEENVLLVLETTNSSGWLDFFADELKRWKDVKASIVKRGRTHFDNYEFRDSDPDTEKELKELKDEETALREHRSAWEARVASPFRSKVEECDRVIEKYAGKARRLTEDNPLIYKEANDDMQKAIASLVKFEWNAAEGRIVKVLS